MILSEVYTYKKGEIVKEKKTRNNFILKIYLNSDSLKYVNICPTRLRYVLIFEKMLVDCIIEEINICFSSNSYL